MPSIDLNCDLGESFGAYTIGMDAEILPYVTSANIACGFHAGDPSVMQKSVLLCKKYGVQVGAHPGLPDLQGFGRRRMAIFPAEAEADVMYQIGALKAFCDAAGVPLHHVKPHGALYNMAARDPVLGRRPSAALCRLQLPVLCYWHSPAARWSRPQTPSDCPLPARYLQTAATGPTAALCHAALPAQ